MGASAKLVCRIFNKYSHKFIVASKKKLHGDFYAFFIIPLNLNFVKGLFGFWLNSGKKVRDIFKINKN
jgi:hypothetical protein